jgi:hypothetical protein
MSNLRNQNHKTPGRGRPRGSTNARKRMIEKLEHLELSPLVKHLKLIVEHEKVVRADDVSNVPSATYTASIIKHRGDLLRTLLPYQYNVAVEEKAAVSTSKPMSIKLTVPKPLAITDQSKEKSDE